MSEHDRIWLEPKGAPDRCWCQDNQWGDEGVEYVRAALSASIPAEIEKLMDRLPESIARAWASIDGHADEFDREKDGSLEYDDPAFTGHYEGYMAEARELMKRSGIASALLSLSARVGELETALDNLSQEMRFMLRTNPTKDGGLYRQRLDEAEHILHRSCPHNCDEGGICLADHAGYRESCARAALSKGGNGNG